MDGRGLGGIQGGINEAVLGEFEGTRGEAFHCMFRRATTQGKMAWLLTSVSVSSYHKMRKPSAILL